MLPSRAPAPRIPATAPEERAGRAHDMQTPATAPSPAPSPPPAAAPRWHRALPWVVALGAILFTAGLLAQARPDIYFSGDAGLKVLLVEQFASGDLSPDLHFQLTPEEAALWKGGFFPFAAPFVYRVGSKVFAWCPLLFEYLTAPAYALLGWRGLYAWPVIGLALTWLVLWRQCRRLALGHAWTALALLALAFCSPLTLYGAIFWEHTLAVALGMIGLELLVAPALASRTWNGLLAGALVGLTPWLRSELVALAAVTGAVVLLAPRLRLRVEGRLAFLGGLAAAGVALVLWNVAVYGDPGGLVYRPAENAVRTDLASRLAGLGWMAPRLFGLLAWHGIAFWLPAVAAAAGLWLRWGDEERRAELRLWGLVAVAFAAALPPMLPNALGGDGGKQFGPRYLLVLFPIAALVLATTAKMLWQRTAGRRRAAVALALAAGCAAGVRANAWDGADELADDYAGRIAPLVDLVLADPAGSLAVLQPLRALEFAPLLPERQLFRVKDPAGLAGLAAALAAQGESRLLLLSDDPLGDQSWPIASGGRLEIRQIACAGLVSWCLSAVSIASPSGAPAR